MFLGANRAYPGAGLSGGRRLSPVELRLLQLPRAWSSFLDTNEHGASCLGPHSGLTMQRDRFAEALSALSDPARTTVVLVARPNASALREAARTSSELRSLGGRPHWGKMHWRTADDLRPVYPRFDEFVAIRDTVDPDRVFGNTYLETVLGR